MDYIYDVFISYRRQHQWTHWTREHLKGLLDTFLTQELGDPPRIFIDEQIEPGADWPIRLGDALARSRVLVGVFSRDYFNDKYWCIHELDLMYARQQQFPDKCLIFPAIGHDGDLIPEEIRRIQSCDLKEFRNPDLQRRTPRFEKFADAINALAPHVADAIFSAPLFQDSWLLDCRTRFNRVYQQSLSGGPAVAVQTLTLKPMPEPARAPRVTI
jgi:hypothetical protein